MKDPNEPLLDALLVEIEIARDTGAVVFGHDFVLTIGVEAVWICFTDKVSMRQPSLSRVSTDGRSSVLTRDSQAAWNTLARRSSKPGGRASSVSAS